MTNGQLRCWRQGSQSTRERSWYGAFTPHLDRPGAQGPQPRMLQCWSRARADKEAKYTEFLQGNRFHLWWWANTFVHMLAAGRAREVPCVLRRSAHRAWRRRWTRMLAVSCGRSFVDSLRSGTRGGELKGRGLISLICSVSSDR